MMLALRDGIESIRQLQKELYLFNIDPGDPIDERLASLFETQNVGITTEQTPSGGPTIAVLSNQDGVLTLIDISKLRALTNQVATGTSSTGIADGEYGDLLAHLKETTFTSYDKEQLQYASREVEDRARRVGKGTIHTGFQRVSNMHNQQHVYRDLARRGVEVHTYGLPDASPPDFGRGRIHAIETDEIGAMWFVIFDGGGDATQKSALIAEERDNGGFYGAWTYDATLVDYFCEYLDQTYLTETPA